LLRERKFDTQCTREYTDGVARVVEMEATSQLHPCRHIHNGHTGGHRRVLTKLEPPHIPRAISHAHMSAGARNLWTSHVKQLREVTVPSGDWPK